MDTGFRVTGVCLLSLLVGFCSILFTPAAKVSAAEQACPEFILPASATGSMWDTRLEKSPWACSYTLSDNYAEYDMHGGFGYFDVDVTPADICAWRVTTSVYWVESECP